MSMVDLIRKLSPYRSGVVCDGLDKVTELLFQELPFQVHEFESGSEVNGWVLPQKWEVQKATIHDNAGNLIYDGNAHPLGVCAYSESFIAGIGGEELKKHLYYSAEYDDALIYHCDWLYKNWVKDWGFSVTKRFYDSIKDREAYHIELRTTKTPGTMKVLEFHKPGKQDIDILINAHNCHPGCANDDLSGVAIGIEVMRQLMTQEAELGYRLIIGPEHYHSIFYLDRFQDTKLHSGVFLESLGTQGPLALQHSFTGDAPIDQYYVRALKDSGFPWREAPFRSVVGNDETCWDSAGYEIATVSLSRVPFSEYHTSHDTADLMDEQRLREAVSVTVEALSNMDKDKRHQRKFRGLVCLSRPGIDLYKPMLDPSMPDRRTISDEARRWNNLMDCLPLYFGHRDELGLSVLEIANRHDLPFQQVWRYVKAWEEKGLVG
jgi:aminopeptidase-like protein